MRSSHASECGQWLEMKNTAATFFGKRSRDERVLPVSGSSSSNDGIAAPIASGCAPAHCIVPGTMAISVVIVVLLV